MYRSSTIRNDSAVLAPVTRPADVSSWNTHTCWVDLVHKTVSRRSHVSTLSCFTLIILYMLGIISKSNDKSQTNSECLLLTGTVSVPKPENSSSSVPWSSTLVYKLLNTHHKSHCCTGTGFGQTKKKVLTQGPLLNLLRGLLTAYHGPHQLSRLLIEAMRCGWKHQKKMSLPNNLF